MAFIGVLLVNFILWIILGAAFLGSVCIITSVILGIIHFIRKKTAKPEIKWIFTASVVLAIAGIITLLLLASCVFIFPHNHSPAEWRGCFHIPIS